MPVPIDECGPLRPIIDAAARGTQLSRLRTFVGVCPRGHTLVEVFPTAAGDFAVWTEQGPDYRLLGAAPTTDELDPEVLAASDAELARRLDDLVPAHRRDRRKMAAPISGSCTPAQRRHAWRRVPSGPGADAPTTHPSTSRPSTSSSPTA